MEYLILIPLKKAYDIDLVKYLKVAITTQYSNVDEKTKESLETLNRMRNNVTNKTMDTRQEHSLETLEKYVSSFECFLCNVNIYFLQVLRPNLLAALEASTS